MYIIKRDDGAYVCDPSRVAHGGSYTRRLQDAKVFTTRDAAERDRCPGNEVVVAVASELNR